VNRAASAFDGDRPEPVEACPELVEGGERIWYRQLQTALKGDHVTVLEYLTRHTLIEPLTPIEIVRLWPAV